MVATGFVDKGAIFGANGSLWAASPGFAVGASSRSDRALACRTRTLAAIIHLNPMFIMIHLNYNGPFESEKFSFESAATLPACAFRLLFREEWAEFGEGAGFLVELLSRCLSRTESYNSHS